MRALAFSTFFLLFIFWILLLAFGPIFLLLKRVADAAGSPKKLWSVYALLLGSGAICGPIAYFLESGVSSLLDLQTRSFGTCLAEAFCVAAIPEETLKFAFLLLFAVKSRRLTRYTRAVSFAAFVSLGFALVENVCYVCASGRLDGAYVVAFMRALTSLPGHFAFSVYMGYFLALAIFRKKNVDASNKLQPSFDWSRAKFRKNIALSWSVAVLVHGLYDFFLMFGESESQFRGLSVVVWLGFFIAVYYGANHCVDELKMKDLARKQSRSLQDDLYRIRTR